jgi:hypothetical protein
VGTDRDRYQGYEVHGSGVETLRAGCAELAMSEERQTAAVRIVSELLAVNEAEDFV